MMRSAVGLLAIVPLLLAAGPASRPTPPPKPFPALPANARLALEEDWSTGKIDPERWYTPRKKWGQMNNGVVPENVALVRDRVSDKEQFVLRCAAHGDQYAGPIVGYEGNHRRVGGMVVSKAFFASGRYEVVMKIGNTERHDGGPVDPTRPIGTVPAIWTYAYRYVTVPREKMDQFVPESPLYNPLMKRYGGGANEYWSEIDFPEFGKNGSFEWGLYNTFCQPREESRTYNVAAAADGKYHTFTTEWRTKLEPLPDVKDAQVVAAEGYHWICDKAVPFERYLGNPLKKLGPDRYAVYTGERADHWIDGRKVAENDKYVPAMAAQLTLGIWLPKWAGPAPWKTSSVSFASVKVWQYDGAGDVRGILTGNLKENFKPDGTPVK